MKLDVVFKCFTFFTMFSHVLRPTPFAMGLISTAAGRHGRKRKVSMKVSLRNFKFKTPLLHFESFRRAEMCFYLLPGASKQVVLGAA